MLGSGCRYHTKAHIALAMLEAVCFQTKEVLDAMKADSGVSLGLLKVHILTITI